MAICGPKSSPVTADALTADPVLDFTNDAGRWVIKDRHSDQVFSSDMDDDPAGPRDVAYVGRLPYRSGTMLLIAGVHAIGSVGAVHYLSRHLPELYAAVDEAPFSMVVRSTHDGAAILESELACPPRRHR